MDVPDANQFQTALVFLSMFKVHTFPRKLQGKNAFFGVSSNLPHCINKLPWVGMCLLCYSHLIVHMGLQSIEMDVGSGQLLQEFHLLPDINTQL
jgi:hypothetical protein